jgi:hypothetical protein
MLTMIKTEFKERIAPGLHAGLVRKSGQQVFPVNVH